MTERCWEKRIGDIWVMGWLIEPTPLPLSSVQIGFKGESERIDISGHRAEEELRDLHYALGRLLSEIEKSRDKTRLSLQSVANQ